MLGYVFDVSTSFVARTVRAASIGKWIVAISACGWMSCVFASDASEVAMQQCRALKGDAERLKCYDAITLPTTSAAGSATSASRVTNMAKPAVAEAAKTPPNANTNNTNAADFGLPASVPAAKVDKIQSTIVGRLSSWQQGTRLRLANGQVWQVTDDSRGFCDCDNVKVEVTRGAFGTFFIEIEGKGNAPRVRRIQ